MKFPSVQAAGHLSIRLLTTTLAAALVGSMAANAATSRLPQERPSVDGQTAPAAAPRSGTAILQPNRTEACCEVVSRDLRRRLVTARDTTTGRTFRFTVRDARLLRNLKAGQSFDVGADLGRLSQDQSFSISVGPRLSGQVTLVGVQAAGTGEIHTGDQPARRAPREPRERLETPTLGQERQEIQSPEAGRLTRENGRVGIAPSRDVGQSPERLGQSSTVGASGGEIAFASNRDGNWEIYVMNADGSGQKRLTNDNRRDIAPAWSPDGTKIAFMRGRSTNAEIWVISSGGGGAKQLTDNNIFDGHPTWSSDGTKIAFSSTRDGRHEIYVMNAGDGRNVERRTWGGGVKPAWSPDGTRIAYVRRPDSLYVMNADGTNNKLVRRSGWEQGKIRSAAWSPDGTRIVFAHTWRIDGWTYQIEWVSAWGCTAGCAVLHSRTAENKRVREQRKLGDPSFSPDGHKIVYWNTRKVPRGNRPAGYARDIITANAEDGSRKQFLTHTGSAETHPAWQPRR